MTQPIGRKKGGDDRDTQGAGGMLRRRQSHDAGGDHCPIGGELCDLGGQKFGQPE